MKRQQIWNRISCLLNYTNEIEPRVISLAIAEKRLFKEPIRTIDAVYEMEGDGTMWLHLEGDDKDTWTDMSELSTRSLKGILKFLETLEIIKDEKYYAFGQEVPHKEIVALLNDGWKMKDLTTENLETTYHYDYQDEL